MLPRTCPCTVDRHPASPFSLPHLARPLPAPLLLCTPFRRTARYSRSILEERTCAPSSSCQQRFRRGIDSMAGWMYKYYRARGARDGHVTMQSDRHTVDQIDRLTQARKDSMYMSTAAALVSRIAAQAGGWLRERQRLRVREGDRRGTPGHANCTGSTCAFVKGIKRRRRRCRGGCAWAGDWARGVCAPSPRGRWSSVRPKNKEFMTTRRPVTSEPPNCK